MRLAGKTLLDHIFYAIKPLKAAQIIAIYGHQGSVVREAMAHHDTVEWVEQSEQLGTGHAVLQALPHIDEAHQVLILCGDVPLITTETLRNLVETTGADQLGLLTAAVDRPFGLGRIVRDDYRQVMAVVEEKDATELQKQICEVNTGVYCVSAKLLKQWLPQLSNRNTQQEYYLTDIVKFAREAHVAINVSRPKAVEEIYGANNRVELANLERIYQTWKTQALMLQGVSMVDPARVDIRGQVVAGQDVMIDVNVIFEGKVEIADNAIIGPNCVIKDAVIGRGVVIAANSMIEGAVIEAEAQVGPFARIRPESVIKTKAKVGNFVELKKTTLGESSKANHLSYLGDTTIGQHVNIGAGTITCNYDSANKHQTVIEDDVFVGSHVQLVAPIKVGKGATIGAGTTVVKDAPAGQLTVGRAPQKVIAGWRRPKKK